MSRISLLCTGLFVAMVAASSSALTSCGAELVMWIADDFGQVGRVRVETGEVLTLIDVGETMTDIAFSPEGELYGITSDSLFLIDAETGSKTNVGDHEIPHANALVFDMHGTLFGAGVSSTLYEIDPRSAMSVAIGDMGFSSAGDLTWNRGRLLLAGTTDLIELNPRDGSGIVIGPLRVESVWGMATANGETYAASGSSIYAVNVDTGKATFIANFAYQGLGSAYGAAFLEEAVPGESAKVGSFTVQTGTHVSGDTADLRESDNERLKIDGAFMQGEQPPYLMVLQVRMRTRVENPTELNVLVEGKLNQNGGTAKIFLRNWAQGGWTLIANDPIGRTEMIQKTGGLDPAQFINASGVMRLRIKHTKTTSSSGDPFRSLIDHVQALVR